MNYDKIRIIDNVVHGGPALNVHGYLNYGQFIIDKLRENAEQDEVALINADTGLKTTYRQILQDVVNVAVGLRKLGVKRGDVVAICSENREEYIPAAIGAICCGATVTTASVMYTKDEMTHVFNISKPSLLFCSEMAMRFNVKTFKSIPHIKKIIQMDGTPTEKGVIAYSSLVNVNFNIDEFVPVDVDGCSDIVYILYSSGTTGLPKGVMISHYNAVYAAANFEVRPEKIELYRTLLTIVPWYHAFGLISTINYMAVKQRIVYFAAFSPDSYLKAIQDYKVNVLLVVPPIVVFLCKSPMVDEYDISSVHVVWCGAAPLSSETIAETLKRFPNCKRILQAYGMTETSLAATKDLDEDTAKSKPGSGGIPLRGIKGKVVDIESRKRLGPNQNGEICLKGPIIMKGYAGDKAATRQIMDDEGFLKTGDIGYYDEDGYFFVVDRLKELIKYKGSQVPPAAVENVLLQHDGVSECGVAGTPDEKAGELPTAFVVLKPDVRVTEKELIEFTNTRLSPEKRLHGGVIFVKEIPKNPSGKILRRVLKQQLAKRKKSKL